MKINYAKKNIIINIIKGLIAVAIGLSVTVWSGTATIGYFWVFFGVLQLTTAWFFKKNPYLSIGNNKITKNSLFRKSIKICDITKVWKYVNSYKIETSYQTLTIDKSSIEPESLNRLTCFLNELEIKDFGMQSN